MDGEFGEHANTAHTTLPLQQPRHGFSIAAGMRVIWIYRKSTIVVLNGSLILLEVAVSIASIVVGRGIARVEGNGLVIVRDSLLVLLKVVVSNAPIVVGIDTVLVQSYRLTICFDRFPIP